MIEHTRDPGNKDRLRALFDNIELVTWHCPECHWDINCDWAERTKVQTCPVCGCRHYVPARAFAWNSRLIRERDTKRRALEKERQRVEEAVHRAREEDARRKRKEDKEEFRRLQRQYQLVQNQIAEVAVGAGLIESKADFKYLDEDDIAGIKTLSDIADSLRSDLMSAMDDNVRAEKGVAYGRPAAAGASILSTLGGYGWAGLAFGAVAVGARWISNDWKRAKMAEYQAKWTKVFTEFNAEQMAVFTRIFSYKYPALASTVAGMQDRLPM